MSDSEKVSGLKCISRVRTHLDMWNSRLFKATYEPCIRNNKTILQKTTNFDQIEQIYKDVVSGENNTYASQILNALCASQTLSKKKPP